MKIMQKQPIFEIFKIYSEKSVFIEMQYGITFKDVQMSEPKKLSAKALV